jgi:hypothetical protein
MYREVSMLTVTARAVALTHRIKLTELAQPKESVLSLILRVAAYFNIMPHSRK